MDRFDAATARALVADINSWEIQSLAPSDRGSNAWSVTIGSTPRIVGDLLPDFDQGSEDGTVFQLEPRDGTAEIDETVLLRRAPRGDADDREPGIVLWGLLTCAYESRDRGTFEGVVGFYEDDAEGDALMAQAETDVSRLTVGRALDEIDAGLKTLEGHGAHVVPHASRILAQAMRLQAVLADGLDRQKASS